MSKLKDFDNLFEKCIARLSIYDHIEVIEQSTEEVQDLRKEVKTLSELFAKKFLADVIKKTNKELGISAEQVIDALTDTEYFKKRSSAAILKTDVAGPWNSPRLNMTLASTSPGTAFLGKAMKSSAKPPTTVPSATAALPAKARAE